MICDFEGGRVMEVAKHLTLNGTTINWINEKVRSL